MMNRIHVVSTILLALVIIGCAQEVTLDARTLSEINESVCGGREIDSKGFFGDRLPDAEGLNIHRTRATATLLGAPTEVCQIGVFDDTKSAKNFYDGLPGLGGTPPESNGIKADASKLASDNFAQYNIVRYRNLIIITSVTESSLLSSGDIETRIWSEVSAILASQK